MCDLLTTLKPHFFPHYACFQYGVGGYELWLARRCIQYIVATDVQDDYEWLQEAKEDMDLPSLTVLLAPDGLTSAISQFPPEHFNLIFFFTAPNYSRDIVPNILRYLKSGGYLVLPTGHMWDILVDWEKIGEGVYRKS